MENLNYSPPPVDKVRPPAPPPAPPLPNKQTNVTVQVDPKAVQEFMKTQGVNIDQPITPDLTDKPTPPPEIPHDPIASDTSMENAVDKNILAQLKVELTDEDRAAFQDALLSGKPIELKVIVSSNRLKIPAILRERLAEEYDLFYNCIAEDQKEGLIADYPHMMLKLQQYASTVQMLQFNKTDFPRFIMPTGTKAEKINSLRNARVEKINPLTEGMWLMWLHALRIFERKQQLLQKEIVSGDFIRTGG